MLKYNINLAHDIIWSRMQRLMAYRLLFLYLGCMSILLIVLGIYSTRQVLEGIDHFKQSQHLEQAFAKKTGMAESNLQEHAGQLKKQLLRDSARIQSLNEALPPTIRSPLPFLTLLVNQAGTYSLHKLSFAQQTKEDPVVMDFDLITQLRNNTANREFIDLWQNNPHLSIHFPDVKQLKVRRSDLASGAVQITQYKAIGNE